MRNAADRKRLWRRRLLSTGRTPAEHRIWKAQVIVRSRFNKYRNGAHSRGITFNMTIEQFFSYWQKPCSYCAAAIDTIGLDRVDNTHGYAPGNVAPCCTPCNRMKGTQTTREFLERCRRITSIHDSRIANRESRKKA